MSAEEGKKSISWEAFRRDTECLVSLLRKEEPFDSIVAVSRGGLVPAAIVARELDVRHIDTVCVRSYSGTVQGPAEMIKEPAAFAGRVLIIDDLADTGATIAVIRAKFPNAVIATVYAKPMGKPVVDIFGVNLDQSVWVVFPWE